MNSLLEIFVSVDDFYEELEPFLNTQLLHCGIKKRNRKTSIHLSEVISILIFFHYSRYRDFKSYYIKHVSTYLTSEFPTLPSYNRFVELVPRVLLPMTYYLDSLKTESTGISFVDSFAIKVCHSKRIGRNKVFDGIGEMSKGTMGYFFGFKLHFMVNDKGEMLKCCFSRGNMDDRRPLTFLAQEVTGKLFGDKGYISQRVFRKLMKQDLKLITYQKKNMKPRLIELTDRIYLRKRSIIETIGDVLKNQCQIEHTRHRSPVNFLVNLVGAVIAYCHMPKKPSIKFTKTETRLLEFFKSDHQIPQF